MASAELDPVRPASVGMKKYLVFTYYAERPLGGFKDYLDAFETLEEALENLLKERNRYYQVVDADTFAIIREGLTMYKDFSPEHFSSGNQAP
jgi:hypothetical protein